MGMVSPLAPQASASANSATPRTAFHRVGERVILASFRPCQDPRRRNHVTPHELGLAEMSRIG